jgi:hypothetical protein
MEHKIQHFKQFPYEMVLHMLLKNMAKLIVRIQISSPLPFEFIIVSPELTSSLAYSKFIGVHFLNGFTKEHSVWGPVRKRCQALQTGQNLARASVEGRIGGS